MKNKIYLFGLTLCLFCGLALPAFAQETDSDQVYCFTTQDFSGEENLQGICITGLPKPTVGTLLLGNRVLMTEYPLPSAPDCPLWGPCFWAIGC